MCMFAQKLQCFGLKGFVSGETLYPVWNAAAQYAAITLRALVPQQWGVAIGCDVWVLAHNLDCHSAFLYFQ